MSFLGWEWRKQPEGSPNTPQQAEPREPEAVACTECGVMVLNRMAQSVSVGYGSGPRYCQAHRKSYSKMFEANVLGGRRYYAELQVSEDGTPIGYVKEKVKP